LLILTTNYLLPHFIDKLHKHPVSVTIYVKNTEKKKKNPAKKEKRET